MYCTNERTHVFRKHATHRLAELGTMGVPAGTFSEWCSIGKMELTAVGTQHPHNGWRWNKFHDAWVTVKVKALVIVIFVQCL
jgi:hypothetical protein